ncbi:MAG: RsfA family transcriptional regulator [Solibacillus sp.]
MSKVRQDAWMKENDDLLAEAVLRHVKEGSTQLNAFEEAGDALNRTAAACGFRWNAVVRRLYEQELTSAKKERKERLRALNSGTKRRATNVYLLPSSNEEETKAIPLSALSLDVVIAYLVRLQHGNLIEQEATKWKQIANVTLSQKKELEHQLESLQRENRAIKDDYEQFVSIMNRARRLVTLDSENERTAPTFKMEKNGNLVIATPQIETGEVQS